MSFKNRVVLALLAWAMLTALPTFAKEHETTDPTYSSEASDKSDLSDASARVSSEASLDDRKRDEPKKKDDAKADDSKKDDSKKDEPKKEEPKKELTKEDLVKDPAKFLEGLDKDKDRQKLLAELDPDQLKALEKWAADPKNKDHASTNLVNAALAQAYGKQTPEALAKLKPEEFERQKAIVDAAAKNSPSVNSYTQSAKLFADAALNRYGGAAKTGGGSVPGGSAKNDPPMDGPAAEAKPGPKAIPVAEKTSAKVYNITVPMDRQTFLIAGIGGDHNGAIQNAVDRAKAGGSTVALVTDQKSFDAAVEQAKEFIKKNPGAKIVMAAHGMPGSADFGSVEPAKDDKGANLKGKDGKQIYWRTAKSDFDVDAAKKYGPSFQGADSIDFISCEFGGDKCRTIKALAEHSGAKVTANDKTVYSETDGQWALPGSKHITVALEETATAKGKGSGWDPNTDRPIPGDSQGRGGRPGPDNNGGNNPPRSNDPVPNPPRNDGPGPTPPRNNDPGNNGPRNNGQGNGGNNNGGGSNGGGSNGGGSNQPQAPQITVNNNGTPAGSKSGLSASASGSSSGSSDSSSSSSSKSSSSGSGAMKDAAEGVNLGASAGLKLPAPEKLDGAVMKLLGSVASSGKAKDTDSSSSSSSSTTSTDDKKAQDPLAFTSSAFSVLSSTPAKAAGAAVPATAPASTGYGKSTATRKISVNTFKYRR